ncbi:glutamate receptor ionotropic, kainate 2 [Caerostris extrusa]|uniref:Glutamate receptor ionotropic, kainate 2 n=1 Tax=Caerostris extrusa TaxID=172846 RepID=A0AAV4SG11_CAEEX|nr:glutamate receptor ionotropic, kainate 2 [Caerostris extrusa]
MPIPVVGGDANPRSKEIVYQKNSPLNVGGGRSKCCRCCACVHGGARAQDPKTQDSDAEMGRYVVVFRFALLLLNLGLRYALPEVIRIGGLFENFDDDREMAFRYAVDRINADDAVLPKSRLSAKIERLKPQSSFHAAKSVCSLVGEGVVAIFGPNSVGSSALVRSTASALHLPHLESHWDLEKGSKAAYTISFFPRNIGTAIYHLVKSKNWRSFTIIYEDAEGNGTNRLYVSFFKILSPLLHCGEKIKAKSD